MTGFKKINSRQNAAVSATLRRAKKAQRKEDLDARLHGHDELETIAGELERHIADVDQFVKEWHERRNDVDMPEVQETV